MNRRVALFAREIQAIALFTLALVALPTRALADAFDLNEASWEGCSELLDIAREELGEARVIPVAVLDWSKVAPEDGVLSLHPMQPMDPNETAAFMRSGGRLGILDDYGRGSDTLERYRIERTQAPSQPVVALRNKPSLAIAEPVIDVVAGRTTGPHPVVARVQQLVTNHPTALRHPNLSPVLRIRAVGEPDAIVAVAGQVGRGRLFAMSDPSAVTNQMLRYPGNRAFVAGLVRYLVDDDTTARRQGRLFIVANRFEESGAFGGGDSIRKSVESELRSLAAALYDARTEGFPPWLFVSVAVAAALGVAAWVARSSAKTYSAPRPRYARRTPLVSQGGVAGRLALLAAPSSPRSLALLELKSALFEALALALKLEAEPSFDAIPALVVRDGKVDADTAAALREVLQSMQRVEASVVAGRQAAVSAAALVSASDVVGAVIAAFGGPAAINPLVSGSPMEKRPMPSADDEPIVAAERGERPG